MFQDLFLNQTSRDFMKMASEVIRGFSKQEHSLTDGVVKVAERESLNPQEIKRLVEKTNTQAVVEMLKTAEDKKQEIDLAEYKEVLEQTHSEGETESVKTASQQSSPFYIPKTRHSKKMEKAASYYQPYLDDFNKEADKKEDFSNYKSYLRNKVRLDLIKVAKEKTKSEIVDKMDSLVSDFSSYYSPDFQKYASEVYSLYGDKAKSVLTGIAKNIKEPVEFVKISSYVDDSKKEIRKFDTIYQNFRKLASIVKEENKIQEDIDAYHKNRQ